MIGDKNISKHFKYKEWFSEKTLQTYALEDKDPRRLLDNRILEAAEALREHFGKPVRICSEDSQRRGYRTPQENEAVGGVKTGDIQDSMHVFGRAMDVSVDGVEPQEVFDWLDDFTGVKFVKLYDTFVHTDVGTR